MLRVLFALFTLSAIAAHADTPTLSVPVARTPISASDKPLLRALGIKSLAVSGACCKVCTVGKACSDTCISREKICHVGPGCACDG
jgi:hypothetical protein